MTRSIFVSTSTRFNLAYWRFNLTTNGMCVGKDEAVITNRTAEKGGFNIKSLPEGVYKVTIKKNGYKEQVVTVAVTDGEMGDLNVELIKN